MTFESELPNLTLTLPFIHRPIFITLAPVILFSHLHMTTPLHRSGPKNVWEKKWSEYYPAKKQKKTKQRQSEWKSCYETVCFWQGFLRVQIERQTVIKQVQKKRGQMTLWNISDVWYWANFSQRSASAVLSDSHQANWKKTEMFHVVWRSRTGSLCPHLSSRLYEVRKWRVQSFLEAVQHQKQLWQACDIVCL